MCRVDHESVRAAFQSLPTAARGSAPVRTPRSGRRGALSRSRDGIDSRRPRDFYLKTGRANQFARLAE